MFLKIFAGQEYNSPDNGPEGYSCTGALVRDEVSSASIKACTPNAERPVIGGALSTSKECINSSITVWCQADVKAIGSAPPPLSLTAPTFSSRPSRHCIDSRLASSETVTLSKYILIDSDLPG